LSKKANSFTKASGSPGTKFSRGFLISWRNSTQWGPLLPKGGGMIQVDIGGHPPIPRGSPPLLLSVFLFPCNLLFLAVFQVLNFRSHFEALNDVFFMLVTNASHALRRPLSIIFTSSFSEMISSIAL
jgi:hypothetical protein